ncbi:uncharacterized protein C8Q71DRAFT_854391 [Rhodofomes roseus]|nr:uncharacterized protein C8Q71DRAFT_854391 [Rhodofomes roseus]KAH9842038.1 hypothetical protein C8Q71DRAFT_854391 [Rhodofomes roseus]
MRLIAASTIHPQGLDNLLLAAFDLEQQQEALNPKGQEHAKEPSTEKFNELVKLRDQMDS